MLVWGGTDLATELDGGGRYNRAANRWSAISTNDAPSVYKEWIDRNGYGFHHWGVATWHFDREVERYRANGHELAFLAKVPSGGRVGYMDTTRDLHGFTEFIELGGAFEDVFGRFYRASIGWDGNDPIRSFV